MKKILLVLFFLNVFVQTFSQGPKPLVLKTTAFKHYVDYFNGMETENIAQAVPNAAAWSWMENNIPLFECPQQNFEELFYFRWWTLRKHLKQTEQGMVMTEFLVPRSYADKYNLIASALGHHIYESRWLLNPEYMDNNIQVWYRGNNGKPLKKLRFYSSWNLDAIYNRFLVNKNLSFVVDLLPDMEQDYLGWEQERRGKSGLFWQYDVRDAMEETISGGRKEKNPRPSINSYMYGNARALAALYKLSGNDLKSSHYDRKADTLKKMVQELLWNPTDQFFEVRKEVDSFSHVREEIGFLPWYFNLPDAGFSNAWKWLVDPKHFSAPFGITTADRSHPAFRTHGCCNCEWDGAVWPFATSQTLTAMANCLNSTDHGPLNDSIYFKTMETYVESMYYRGRPYIGEYLDEKTGYWLKGDQERSRYYNHSTFNDLIISGLVGIRPRLDEKLEIRPLLPKGKWDWFCLDRIAYHGRMVTLIWDKSGEKYRKGKGFSIWVDGKKRLQSPELKPIEIEL